MTIMDTRPNELAHQEQSTMTRLNTTHYDTQHYNTQHHVTQYHTPRHDTVPKHMAHTGEEANETNNTRTCAYKAWKCEVHV